MMIVLVVIIVMMVGDSGGVVSGSHHRCSSVTVVGRASTLRRYSHCSVIEGYLRIHLVGEPGFNWTRVALRHLRQVTGHVLLYRVNHLESLGQLLPRLKVIRGHSLYRGHALVLHSNTDLRRVALSGLKILRGSVWMERNWNLCPGPPSLWAAITNTTSNVIKYNYNLCVYLPCEEQNKCNPHIPPTSPVSPHFNNTTICHQDECRSKCVGQTITSEDLGWSLQTCSSITGSLDISLTGTASADPENVTQQLEENLNLVKRVSGYVRVYNSPALYSLHFLRNLQEIGGEQLVDDKYSLYVVKNENLHELWDWNNRGRSLTITRGKILVQHNHPLLSPTLVAEFAGRVHATTGPKVTTQNTRPNMDPEMSLKLGNVHTKGTSVWVWWQHLYSGIGVPFIIGYNIFYRESRTPIGIHKRRDACKNQLLWERVFVESNEVRSEMNVTLRDLRPYTNYSIYVLVYCIGDDGYKVINSAIHNILTGASEPTPVRELHGHTHSSTSLGFTWSPPSDVNGPDLRYSVILRKLERPTSQTNQECVKILKKRNHEDLGGIHTHSRHKVNKGSNRCCQCNRYTRSTSEDRQYEANFEAYIRRELYTKSLEEDESKEDESDDKSREENPHQTSTAPSTTSLLTTSESPTTTYHTGFPITTAPSIKVTPHTVRKDGDVFNTTRTHYYISSLESFTHYQVLVRACCDDLSMCSPPTIITDCTLPDLSKNKIEDFRHYKRLKDGQDLFQLASHTSLFLVWQPPSSPCGPPLAYHILYHFIHLTRVDRSEQLISVSEEEAASASYTHRLQGLLPGTYNISIYLLSLAGEGPNTTISIKVGDEWCLSPMLFSLSCLGMFGICLMEVTVWFRRHFQMSTTSSHQSIKHHAYYKDLQMM